MNCPTKQFFRNTAIMDSIAAQVCSLVHKLFFAFLSNGSTRELQQRRDS